MWRPVTTAFLLALSPLLGAAEPKVDGLAELRWLIGEWRGVGEGDPGTSGSERHVDSFLDGQFIRATGALRLSQAGQESKGRNPRGAGRLELRSGAIRDRASPVRYVGVRRHLCARQSIEQRRSLGTHGRVARKRPQRLEGALHDHAQVERRVPRTTGARPGRQRLQAVCEESLSQDTKRVSRRPVI
jgi:hypothetical protein